MMGQGDALLQKELSGDSSLEVRRLGQIWAWVMSLLEA